MGAQVAISVSSQLKAMLEQEFSARHLLDGIMVWDVQSHDTEGLRSFRDKMESLWMVALGTKESTLHSMKSGGK